jgi:diaminohydroxyphosphoribosylaminopyrimidine deaminase/5-amino-6-(5-phosphoribosylamino)uracil reductase
VIATKDPNPIACKGAKLLEDSGIEVKIGVMEKEAKELIEPFIAWNRNKSFIFFKIALTINSVYDGGVISSKASRELVHRFRDKIDLLVIGGESVRVDRPTLDSRFVNGKAPDILILSSCDDFDRDIPLFHIKGRRVFIEDSLERLKDYRFIMVEGGNGMLKTFIDIADWLLIFRSSKLKNGKSLQLDRELERLEVLRYNSDQIEWYKIKKDF